MPTAAQLRTQIESKLDQRIPAALTPSARTTRPTISTGIPQIDDLLNGGLPIGAISEITGPECSGRTTLAMSTLSALTHADQVCAWIDVSDSLDIESAAANGIRLPRLLWVRCGVAPASTPSTSATPQRRRHIYIGGGSSHPRSEECGMSTAVGDLLGSRNQFQENLQNKTFEPRCATPQHKPRPTTKHFPPLAPPHKKTLHQAHAGKPWNRLDQALRITDLILQAGGFSAIVLDLGSIAPEHVSRIPLATWFRFRAAADNARTSLLLLTQHSCAKSSAGLLLRMSSAVPRREQRTVFTGFDHQLEAARIRFEQEPTNMVPLRKPPQRISLATWQTRTPYTGTK